MGWPYKSDGWLSRAVLGLPATWDWWTAWLYALAAYYVVGFVIFWVRLQRAEKAAKTGEQAAVERFNAMLRGFPNAVFAKQFGKRPFETAAQAAAADTGKPRH
jgi:hypothetical protein